jgi:hypothetical protein
MVMILHLLQQQLEASARKEKTKQRKLHTLCLGRNQQELQTLFTGRSSPLAL